MKTKAFTLIEILLCVAILATIMTAVVFNMDSLMNSRNVINSKVNDYVTLTRFVKANATIHGKTMQILVHTNKLKAVEIDNEGNVSDIATLQFQLEALNDSAVFAGEPLTFYPDGTLHKESTVSIGLENETNFVFVNINDWNKVSLTTTNTQSIVDEDFNNRDE